ASGPLSEKLCVWEAAISADVARIEFEMLAVQRAHDLRQRAFGGTRRAHDVDRGPVAQAEHIFGVPAPPAGPASSLDRGDIAPGIFAKTRPGSGSVIDPLGRQAKLTEAEADAQGKRARCESGEDDAVASQAPRRPGPARRRKLGRRPPDARPRLTRDLSRHGDGAAYRRDQERRQFEEMLRRGRVGVECGGRATRRLPRKDEAGDKKPASCDKRGRAKLDQAPPSPFLPRCVLIYRSRHAPRLPSQARGRERTGCAGNL